jgi:hypothetical protein
LDILHIALVLGPKFVQFRSKILQRIQYFRLSLGLRCLLKRRCLQISFVGPWLAVGHAYVARRELVPRAKGTSPHSWYGGQVRDGKSREGEPCRSRLSHLSLRWRSGHCYGCLSPRNTGGQGRGQTLESWLLFRSFLEMNYYKAAV